MNLHPIMAAALAPYIPPAFADTQDDDFEPHEAICNTCSCSGEGMYDGSTCPTCRGTGVVWVTE